MSQKNGALSGLYGGMNMAKVMYGQDAIHIPFWMVGQNKRTVVPFAGGTRSLDLLFGSQKTHVLVVGEIIVRPHIVVASDDFVGRGIGGFWTDLPTADEWLRNGDIIVATELGLNEFKGQ